MVKGTRMDIEIHAQGRSVKISNIDGETAQDCTAVALELWAATDPALSNEELGGGTSISTERAAIPVGFVDVTMERPDVK